MLTRRFYGPNAVVEGERYGLNLLLKNPHLLYWIPICYRTADHEFQNPSKSSFEYNYELKRVTQHTIFSKFISDLVYYSKKENLPFDLSLNFKTNMISFIFLILFWFIAYF